MKEEAMSNEYEVGHRFERRGNVAQFDFLYPRMQDQRVATLVVGLEDVRAANDIHIRYDFDRDGWVIESPSQFMWYDSEDLSEHRIEEVAFIPAFSPAAEAELERMNGPVESQP